MERFQSIGAVIVLLVIVFAFLMCIDVVPLTKVTVGSCLAALGVSRFA